MNTYRVAKIFRRYVVLIDTANGEYAVDADGKAVARIENDKPAFPGAVRPPKEFHAQADAEQFRELLATRAENAELWTLAEQFYEKLDELYCPWEMKHGCSDEKGHTPDCPMTQYEQLREKGRLRDG